MIAALIKQIQYGNKLHAQMKQILLRQFDAIVQMVALTEIVFGIIFRDVLV